MRLLLLRARSDGFNAIEGLVRADDVAMLALAKSLRFAIPGEGRPDGPPGAARLAEAIRSTGIRQRRALMAHLTKSEQ